MTSGHKSDKMTTKQKWRMVIIGWNEFDNNGINTIYNFVNGDIKGAQTRLEKLSNLAKNNSKYKYILKVDNLK